MQITNNPAANNIHVDYNGRVYSYMDLGLLTIVVNTRNATKDEVISTDLSS